jgi:hypothetical protein
MIVSHASWRFACLAAAVAAGLVVAFARAATATIDAPVVELPRATERIDDGLPRGWTTLHELDLDLGGGVLEDTPVDLPRHDRGY